MAAIPGSIEDKFQRTYIAVQPDAALGPVTLNLAVSLTPGTGGLPPVKATYNFSGDLPIKSDTQGTIDPEVFDVTTSMMIEDLADVNDINRPE